MEHGVCVWVCSALWSLWLCVCVTSVIFFLCLPVLFGGSSAPCPRTGNLRAHVAAKKQTPKVCFKKHQLLDTPSLQSRDPRQTFMWHHSCVTLLHARQDWKIQTASSTNDFFRMRFALIIVPPATYSVMTRLEENLPLFPSTYIEIHSVRQNAVKKRRCKTTSWLSRGKR